MKSNWLTCEIRWFILTTTKTKLKSYINMVYSYHNKNDRSFELPHKLIRSIKNFDPNIKRQWK